MLPAARRQRNDYHLLSNQGVDMSPHCNRFHANPAVACKLRVCWLQRLACLDRVLCSCSDRG